MLIIFVVLSGAVLYFFYQSFQRTMSKAKDTDLLSEKEMLTILAKKKRRKFIYVVVYMAAILLFFLILFLYENS